MTPTCFRHRCWFGLALALLLPCGCAQKDSASLVTTIDGASQVTAEEIVSKTFNTGTKPKVAVEVFLGPIEIVAGKDETIHATLTKRAGGKTKEEAEDALKELTLTIDENKDGVRIVAVLPKGKRFSGGVSRATGTLDLTTSLAKIDVDAPCIQVTAKNSQGAIAVVGAKGPLKLTTSLADIVVKAEGAEVEAINSQGGITIQGATGRIKAKTSLAQITVEAQDAVVDTENSQGSVAFRGSLAPGKHSFRTSLANVSLTLPAQASFRIDATTSLGTIANAFPLTQTEKSTVTRLVGAVGAQPEATVHVNVSQGSVAIQKGK